MIYSFPATNPPERISLTCALGIRFLDVATGKWVTEGLLARAWPLGRPHGREQALSSVVSPSGVHSFHALPGLRSFEISSAGDPWVPAPLTREFQVEVVDKFGRFLPCTFTVTPPIRGFAVLSELGSPARLETEAIPLFSSPSRLIPAGLGVIRAELKEQATQQPAAWAFVEAVLSAPGGDQKAQALADEAGRLAILFGYPEGQRRAFGGSPPGFGQGLARQQWSFTLNFFHLAILSPNESPEPVADYARRLNQPSVQGWISGSPAVPAADQSITYGVESQLGVIELIAT